MKRRSYCIGIIAAFLCSCGLVPEKVRYDDPKLQPFWKALESVDRTSLGFTPISKTADIRLEHARRNYDAMLHIYETTSRTIAFRKVGDGYKWIHEQEGHTGPKKYKTVDGTLDEKLVITYETENVSGVPLNEISIRYFGEDPRLSHRRDLTLDYIRPIIEQWDALKHK